MAAQPKYVFVFDFETGGTITHVDGRLDADAVEPIQIAGLAIDVNSLRVVPGSTFSSMMRATSRDVLKQEALRVNKKTPDEIMAAPDRETVWKRFTEHVKKFNPRPGSPYTAPIPAGKNIRGFDLPIVEGLCRKWGPSDKSGRQTLFNQRTSIDLEDDIWRFFVHRPEELPDHKMDTVRGYFGISSDNAHDALVDVQQTTGLIIKFIKLYRTLGERVTFKDSMKDFSLAA